MKVSIIIPVYNVEKYIEECISSVRNQTLSDIEIICVNDAGTDNSLKVLKEIQKLDSRITIIENEINMGLAYSRNVGLNAAKGEYVYFLDSDDMIVANAMEELYDLSKRDNLDAAVFCADFIYENESLREKFSSNPAVFKGKYDDVYSGRDLYVKWMEVWDWMPSQPRYFYNRQFLIDNNISYINGMLHEDETFAFDVLMNADRMRVLDKAYFIRRFRSDSIMTKNVSMKNVMGCYRILQHVTKWANDFIDEGSEHKKALLDAIRFYKSKIAANARGKLKAACDLSGQDIDLIKPMVSIIIPVYNVKPYLMECIDSVIAQTLIDIEIICVDDGSTDGSEELFTVYEKLDPRIISLYNKENCGQSVARNKGLNVARGKYVYMLDADDKISADTLEDLVNMCEQDDLDIIGFENRQFADSPEFEDRAKAVLFTYKNIEGIYQGKDAFITCMDQDVISPSVPTFLFRREYLEREKIRFIEHILHEDIGFILEVLLKADKVRLIHKKCFFRRFRANSTVTGGFATRQMEGYLKSWQKYFECYDYAIRNYEDENLLKALDKWKRNVLGRIRMLYTESEEHSYLIQGGSIDESTRRLLEAVREMTSNVDRAYSILGKEVCDRLASEGQVYICGTGQYAHRILELVGSLDIHIKGIISKDSTRKNFCGFPIINGNSDMLEKEITVLLAYSHYQSKEYETLLDELGLNNRLAVDF